MARLLDSVKIGDWVEIIVDGIQKFEQVKQASFFTIKTDNYTFTRYGHGWPKHKTSVVVMAATSKEAKHWFEESLVATKKSTPPGR